MFKKYNTINNISAGLLILISWIYFYKYSSIYIGNPFLLSIIYISTLAILIILADRIPYTAYEYISKRILIVILVLLLLLAFCWVTFIPRYGNIGRLPAIVDWIDRFFSGRYPYNSPVTPSGFPFLYFIAMPFYFVKNVGYLEISGLIFFSYAIFYFSHSTKEVALKILIVIFIPVIYYELAVRGELFANSVMPLILLILMEKYLEPYQINFRFISLAIISGLILSTRSVVGLIYIIYVLFYFRSQFKNGLIFSLIVVFVFLVILFPFISWDFASFIKNGPFAIQAFLSHLPKWVIIVVLLFSIYAGWIVSDVSEVLFASGVMLFVPVFLSMIYAIAKAGFYNAVVGDVFDISYYIFCVPFLILSLKKYKKIKAP